jgi:rRNA maturation protein Nop10
MKLKKCDKCKKYTLKNKCSKCNEKTSDAHYEFENLKHISKNN